MLLGNAHIEEAAAELLPEAAQACAALHGGGNGAELFVLPGQAAEGLAELVGEALGFFAGVAGGHIKAGEAVVDGGVLLGVLVALALIGAHVEQHRLVDELGCLQGDGQLFDVVAVKGAVVGKAHILEDGGVVKQAFHPPFQPAQQRGDDRAHHGELLQGALQVVFRLDIAGLGADVAEVPRHGAHVF